MCKLCCSMCIFSCYWCSNHISTCPPHTIPERNSVHSFHIGVRVICMGGVERERWLQHTTNMLTFLSRCKRAQLFSGNMFYMFSNSASIGMFALKFGDTTFTCTCIITRSHSCAANCGRTGVPQWLEFGSCGCLNWPDEGFGRVILHTDQNIVREREQSYESLKSFRIITRNCPKCPNKSKR